MSNGDQSNQAGGFSGDETFWDRIDVERAEAQPVDGGVDVNLDDAHPDSQADFVEASAKEVKGSSKAKYFIAVAAVAVLGVAGSIGYSLYSKLFAGDGAQDEVALAGGAPVIDTQASLPGMAAQPAGGAAPGLVAAPSLPEQSVTESVTEVASTSTVVLAPSQTVAPAAPVVAPSSPAVLAQQSAPVQASELPSCAPVAVAPVCPQAQRSSPTRSSADYKKKSAPRKHVAVKTEKRAKPAAPEKAPAEEVISSDRLVGFKVLAIEPKTGDHQQAWIRGRDGKLHIVREGELFQGSRVTSVRFAEGVVKTTGGEIRR